MQRAGQVPPDDGKHDATGPHSHKQNVKADVLKQIQGKSSGDAKVAKTTNPDGSTSSVIKHPNGSTTTVNKNKSGTLVTNKDKRGVGTFTSFDTNGNKTTAGTLDGKGEEPKQNLARTARK